MFRLPPLLPELALFPFFLGPKGIGTLGGLGGMEWDGMGCVHVAGLETKGQEEYQTDWNGPVPKDHQSLVQKDENRVHLKVCLLREEDSPACLLC